MNYIEDQFAGNIYRKEYLDGLLRYIENEKEAMRVARDEYMADFPHGIKKRRNDFKKMLGCPLAYKPDGLPQVERSLIHSEKNCSVYRMQIEVLPGVKFYGILLVNGASSIEAAPIKPLVIVKHGYLGCPEVAAGLFGNTGNYNNLGMRIFSRGVHIFAPQTLTWYSKEYPDYGNPFDHLHIDSRLRQHGSSITAVELSAMSRSLDYILSTGITDEKHIGMAGLSYGGFYALFMAAADTRIKSAITCAVFNDREKYVWQEWDWFGSSRKLLDAEIGALVYPRHLHIIVPDHDELFEAAPAQAEFDRLKDYYARGGLEQNLSFRIFSGVHEYPVDDDEINMMIAEIT